MKIIIFARLTVVGMLILPVNVLAAVYDDAGNIIIEEEIEAEMGSAMSRILCGCLGEMTGFMALAVIGGEGDPSTRDLISGVLITSAVCTAVGYLLLEMIERGLGYKSYPKYRAIGSLLGGLSLFAAGVGILSISRGEDDYFSIALASLPAEVGLGTLIGYKIGKPFDRKIAINRIKEKRRNQKQSFWDSGNSFSIKIPLLAVRF